MPVSAIVPQGPTSVPIAVITSKSTHGYWVAEMLEAKKAARGLSARPSSPQEQESPEVARGHPAEAKRAHSTVSAQYLQSACQSFHAILDIDDRCY